MSENFTENFVWVSLKIPVDLWVLVRKKAVKKGIGPKDYVVKILERDCQCDTTNS